MLVICVGLLSMFDLALLFCTCVVVRCSRNHFLPTSVLAGAPLSRENESLVEDKRIFKKSITKPALPLPT